MAKKYTQASDDAYDKKHGIKKGSKKDKALDKKRGLGSKKKVMSKSQAAKKAKSGADMGKPGKNFKKIAAKAGKKYGSAVAGKKVAGSIFQKMRASGKL